MKQVVKYVTKDGVEFDTQAEAEKHEAMVEITKHIDQFLTGTCADKAQRYRTMLHNALLQWENYKFDAQETTDQ